MQLSCRIDTTRSKRSIPAEYSVPENILPKFSLCKNWLPVQTYGWFSRKLAYILLRMVCTFGVSFVFNSKTIEKCTLSHLNNSVDSLKHVLTLVLFALLACKMQRLLELRQCDSGNFGWEFY